MSASKLHTAVNNQDILAIRAIFANAYTNANERDKSLQTPLHSACYLGNLEIVKFLLTKQVDVNSVDINGWTPLHCAIHSRKLELIQAILNHPKVNTQLKTKDGTSVLHYIVRNNYSEDEEAEYKKILQIIIDKGADINATDKNFETPLHRATRARNFAAIKFLVERGCNIEAKNMQGETALFYAVQLEDEYLVRYYLINNANIYVESNKKEAILDIASEKIRRIMEEQNAGDMSSLDELMIKNAISSKPTPLIIHNDKPSIPSLSSTQPVYVREEKKEKIVQPLNPSNIISNPFTPNFTPESSDQYIEQLLQNGIQNAINCNMEVPNFCMMNLGQLMQYNSYIDSQLLLIENYLTTKNNPNFAVNFAMKTTICPRCNQTTLYSPNTLAFSCTHCLNQIRIG